MQRRRTPFCSIIPPMSRPDRHLGPASKQGERKEEGKGRKRRNEEKKVKKVPEEKTVEELLDNAGIKLTRTINTDAVLAEQLLQELKRREVDLKPCGGKRCNPRIALISEWDTLYGRSLPAPLRQSR